MGLLSRARDWPVMPEGKYRIEGLLGRGGMGSVYAARDVTLDRPVAIKVIRPELVPDPAARERFNREAQTLARLKHPSIVTVFACGSLPDGGPYLVMELVSGVDLRRELAAEGRLDPARASRILAAVCGAMESAHRDGVLHGDLKPENIMLPDDAEGEIEAKVLDFGVAQAIAMPDVQRRSGPEARPPEWSGACGGSRPSTDARGALSSVEGGERRREGVPGDEVLRTTDVPIVGTPAYMAPEQLRGQPPSPGTDVFSLGVIAYEMLIGELPFGRGSAAEVALAQERGIPAGHLDPLPPALARAVTAALAIDADRRPVSAQALAHLIGAAAGGL
jgi:eukaryotic-like serine/threonine-protein kinase